MQKPELKQFGELRAVDFERHPIWISCHTEDQAESWFDETDEETFRPWTGSVPVRPSDGMLLVRATLTLSNGSIYRGFVTPAFKEADLGTLQPQIFVGAARFAFWGGMPGVHPDRKAAFYAAVGTGAEAIFPVEFAADAGLATGVISGRIEGFYRRSRDTTEVER